MRPGQNGRSHAHRLDRVLPAPFDKRAADEGDRRQRIERAELADRIGNIDVRIGGRQLPRRAPRNSEALGLQLFCNGPAPIGMARSNDGAQP